MQKIILTGKHGRPSTKMAWSTVETDLDNTIILVQRRQFYNKRRKKSVCYYRIFGDTSVYNSSQLYQLKLKNFNFDNSVVIRWGTREVIDAVNCIIYNKASAIAIATNKGLSRETFIKNGINTPRLLHSPSDYRSGKIIARPLIHSKGKNFVVLNNKSELTSHFRKGWYYSEYIDKVREFRIHVGHSKVLAIMEKSNPNGKSLAWNRAVNHTDPFSTIGQKDADDQDLREVMLEAIRAVNCLGLDMGGVDVMVDKDNVPYILEVNTAPTLNSSPRVANLWAKYWSYLLNDNNIKYHWDYTIFKKASSLFWKQNQF